MVAVAQPTVLISGAGIAGPSLAFWLTKNGYRVIVVEIADGIRPGGQTVDLRGAGGDVVERMGLMPQMRAHALDQHGVAWVASDGSRRAEMPVTAFDGNGLVSTLEILRGDLVDVLYQSHQGFRRIPLQHQDFGAEPKRRRRRRHPGRRHAAARGPRRRRGRAALRGARLGVRTRGRVRQPARRLQRMVHRTRPRRARRLVPHVPGARRSERVHATNPRSREGQGGLGFCIRADQLRPPRHRRATPNARRAVRGGGLAVRCPAHRRTAKPTTSTSTHSSSEDGPSWTSGRVALVGDAGYCASPLSGMGTSLALVGAYLLAGELGRPRIRLDAHGCGAALQRYANLMRPYVDKCQDLPAGIDGYAPNRPPTSRSPRR